MISKKKDRPIKFNKHGVRTRLTTKTLLSCSQENYPLNSTIHTLMPSIRNLCSSNFCFS